MNPAWRAFADEIGRWRDCGRTLEFWWRDDDADKPSPSLARLLALRAEAHVPLALAVVPASAEEALFDELGPGVSVLQHGVDHYNRAHPGEKKTEFSLHESPNAALARLRASRERLTKLAGSRALPVLAPPWNRIPQQLALRLAQAGITGLSTYGPRPENHAGPGIVQVNTHVDIVAWRSGGAFAGEEHVLSQAVRHLAARRDAETGSAEPTGWLTHHARHDEAGWSFLRRLFEFTRGYPGLHWRSAGEIFAVPEQK